MKVFLEIKKCQEVTFSRALTISVSRDISMSERLYDDRVSLLFLLLCRDVE